MKTKKMLEKKVDAAFPRNRFRSPRNSNRSQENTGPVTARFAAVRNIRPGVFLFFIEPFYNCIQIPAVMKIRLPILILATFLLSACHMDAYYANKRIAHEENIVSLETPVVASAKKVTVLYDQVDEFFSESQHENMVEMVYPDSTETKIPEAPQHKKSKKEKATSSKTATNAKGVPLYNPGKKQGSSGDSHAGVWIFWGSAVTASVLVGILTHSVWIGLLTFAGILVLLALFVFVFVLLFVI